MLKTTKFRELMELAADLALNCSPCATAFSVGAVLADSNGEIISTGYSRELGNTYHAEHIALEKANLTSEENLILFTSLEPCSIRLSGRKSCCSLLIENGIKTVFVGSKEPPIFVKGEGCKMLRDHGIKIIELEGFEQIFQRANAHLLLDRSAV
jgi:pyrimidine deaminase RibD-like protein